MSKTRFRIVAVLSLTICPMIGVGMRQDDRYAAEDAKLERAMRRSIANRAGDGVQPANNQPACTPVVTNVYGWETNNPDRTVGLHDTFDLTCLQAAANNPCATVTVITVFSGGGQWALFHRDNTPLACGSETIVTNSIPTGGPAGEYTANVDIYSGTWATWTSNTPVLGDASFSFDVP